MKLILFNSFTLQDGNVRFIDNYDDELSHLIFAGSDILLCPSFDNLQLQVPVRVANFSYYTENKMTLLFSSNNMDSERNYFPMQISGHYFDSAVDNP